MRAFPTIFPRHLDFPMRSFEHLIFVNDSAGNDEIMVVSVNTDPTKKRRDGWNQQHSEHPVTKLAQPD